jgi:acylphosphatase
MPAEEPIARRVIVEGFVQGVGYRHFAYHAASRLGLSGWPQAIEAMLAELRRGPRGAQVRSVVLAEAVGAEWTRGRFEIRPSA